MHAVSDLAREGLQVWPTHGSVGSLWRGLHLLNSARDQSCQGHGSEHGQATCASVV